MRGKDQTKTILPTNEEGQQQDTKDKEPDEQERSAKAASSEERRQESQRGKEEEVGWGSREYLALMPAEAVAVVQLVIWRWSLADLQHAPT